MILSYKNLSLRVESYYFRDISLAGLIVFPDSKGMNPEV
jgi:hypothetical protein